MKFSWTSVEKSIEIYNKFKKLINEFEELPQEEQNYFSSQIFCGNDTACFIILKLLSKIDRAVTIIGGLQQPIHWDHEPSSDELKEELFQTETAERELQNILLDIIEAFGYNSSKIKLEKRKYEKNR